MRRLLPFLLVFLLVAVGCGDDDEGGEDVASEDTTEGPVDEPVDEPDDEDDPVVDDESFLRFTALGLDTDTGVLEFGDDADEVIDVVHATWGDPESDTGESPTGTDCPSNAETYRRVQWDGLLLEFLDGEFRYWLSSSPDQAVFAFVGDETTVPVQPGQTTVAELSESLGDAFRASDEPPLGPSFVITDNWGELGGELSDVSDEGVVQSVRSGIGCGE